MNSSEESAIIFVNNDLVQQVKDTLIRQLFIHEAMDGYEFDDRLAADPNYVDVVHLNGLRILVIRSFFELTNREAADIVIFVKAGLASVEANKFGPPGLTLPVDRLYLHELVEGVVPVVFIPDPNVQNNILHPLNTSSTKIVLNPFGTDPPEPLQIIDGSGTSID